MKKTVLVTGASGMLGRILVHVLQRSFNVVVSKFDITSRAQILDEAKNIRHVDTIIHSAAMTEVNECERKKKECRKINVQGTAHMVELARHFGADIIYISSPMVFNGKRGGYTEQDKTSPLNYYAKTKAVAEKLILAYKHGLVIRVNPIGIRPKGAHPSFIQWFVNMARLNKSFTLFSDVVINPVSTYTLAGIMRKLIILFHPGILHIGSRTNVNKKEIWDLIVAKFPNFSGKVTIMPLSKTIANQIASRPNQMWLNVEASIKRGMLIPRWEREVMIVLRKLLQDQPPPSF